MGACGGDHRNLGHSGGYYGDLVVVSKYKNKPVTVAGDSYRSKREASRHLDLLLMQKSGEITGLTREVTFVLAPGVKIMDERALPPIRYVADFVYCTSDGSTIVEDCKGFRTPVYKLKRHLMATIHGIEVIET
jgi:hypothetical protein